jgi:hypothetical protein
MDGEQERLSYLEKIFDAIRKNAEAIARNEDTLTQLVERTNEFYKSLFSPKNKGTRRGEIQRFTYSHTSS